MTRRALTFGSVAAAYERFRPGYPDEVAAAILAYAVTPIGNALEIGAGTGKATRLLAAHGVAVTATEPDLAMIDELRKHVPPSVTIVRASLEDFAPTATFDLVYAAAALHWTRPEQRWERVATALAPHGVFASFGGPTRIADPDLENAVRIARSPWLADDDFAPPGGTPVDATMRWPGSELSQSDLFTDVRQLTIERRVTLTSDDYVGLLSTISAYLELTDTHRAHALEKIGSVLPTEVAVVADIDLHLARKA